MPRRAILPLTLCPMGRAAELLGDRATLLLLRELFRGCRRFELLALNTGLRPQLVSTRLKLLRAADVVEPRVYQSRPLRHEYWLTSKGEALFTVFLAMRNWAERWAYLPGEKNDAPAIRYVHRDCGADMGTQNICPRCGAVPSLGELIAELSEDLQAEYAARSAADINMGRRSRAGIQRD